MIFLAGSDTLLREPILVRGRPGAADAITIVHYDRAHLRFALEHSGRGPYLEGPVLECDPDRLHEILIRLREPAFAGNRAERPGHVFVQLDGAAAFDFDAPLYPAPLDETWVGENPIGMSGEPAFRGAIIFRRWLP